MKTLDVSQVTVGAASAQVVAANPKRKGLVITNPTANPIRVGFTNPQTATTGQRLAQGEKFILESTPGHNCPTDAIYAIREGGSDGAVSGYEISRS
jgi:hypothetical protein